MTSKIKFGFWAIIICSFCSTAGAIETSYLKGRSVDRFLLSGSLDLRTQVEADNGADNRLNERISAKFGVATELDSQLAVAMDLATANSWRSTRQTLGDQKAPGSQRRPYGIQRAYADWHPEEWISIKLGRTPQVHSTVGDSEILFDDTIALEGATLEMKKEFGDWRLEFQGGSEFVRENYDSFYSVEQSDVMINWAQVVVLSENYSLGAGFFNFAAIQGTSFKDINADASPDGNSESPAGVVKNRYMPKQIFAETRWKIGSGLGKIFAEGIINDDTADPNKALWTGIAWQAERWGWQLAFGEIDSDAVPSFTMSSSFADGHTDSRGVQLGFNYKPTRKISFEFTQIANRLYKTTRNEQYLLSQMDMKVSF